MECLAIYLSVEPLVEAAVSVADLTRYRLSCEKLARCVLSCRTAATLVRVKFDLGATGFDDISFVSQRTQVFALDKIVVGAV